MQAPFVLTCKIVSCAQVRNYVYRFREERFASLTDAFDFVKSVSRDPDSYIRVDVDEADRLRAVFWATSSQCELAERFADVVIQDNTAKTNRYVPGNASDHDPL